MAIVLPTEKSVPVSDPGQLTTLLYGQPKVGKSTFASEYPDAIFLSTEPGLNSLSVYKVDVRSWEEFGEAWAQLKKDDRFRTIIIDTVDNLYDFCREYVLKTLGISHESEESYGKAYAMIKKEFHRAINAMANNRFGLVLISHAAFEEEKTRAGAIRKAYPNLPKKAREVVMAMVDLILYADTIEYVKEEGAEAELRRVIHTKGADTFEAGDRTGKLPELIPLDYKKFEKCLQKAVGGK